MYSLWWTELYHHKSPNFWCPWMWPDIKMGSWQIGGKMTLSVQYDCALVKGESLGPRDRHAHRENIMGRRGICKPRDIRDLWQTTRSLEQISCQHWSDLRLPEQWDSKFLLLNSPAGGLGYGSHRKLWKLTFQLWASRPLRLEFSVFPDLVSCTLTAHLWNFFHL